MPGGRPRRAARYGEQGQALVLVAGALTVMLLMAAVAIEMGRIVSERRYLQNAVDAATLAGALEFRESLADGDNAATATSNARTRALTTLQTYFANDPTGTTPSDPADPPQYDSSCGTAPTCLINGILVNPPSEPGGVRVALQNQIGSTFAQVTALVTGSPIESFTVGARAYAGPDPGEAGPLPIAVREFIDGQPGGAAPCPAYAGGPSEYFRSVFSTEATSCVGTRDSAAGRAVSSTTVPGPKVPILASGADANNGISFRGFVALDIRDFSTPTSQRFYNGVTASTNPNTLKQMQAEYICSGYPGPPFPPVVTPPDPGLQVAALDGNSAGIAVDELTSCYTAGDLITVLVYDGDVRSIPEFVMEWGGGSKPYEIQVPATGSYANNRSFRVARNQAFNGQVSIDTLWDPNDPDNPFNNGTLTSVPPISYSPNPVTPSLGGGTSVNIENVSTTGATPGIYSLLIRGTAMSYSNQLRYLPATINVGGVARDFQINGPSPNGCDIALSSGDTIGCNFSISNIGGGGSAFGGTVTFTVERLDGTVVQTFGAGVGVGQVRQTSISTSGLSQGVHWYVIRATGLNQDGQKVTRLLPFSINVAPSSSPGDDEYVDIKGYAIMRIVCAPGPQCMPPNRVDAEALTGILGSLDDPAFDILKEIRLLPWTYSP